jgi:flavin-binding protein dodecin
MKFSPEVAQRINDLADKHDGRITAEMVVADARKKTSPLHGLFEWDIDKAAHQHWLDRARTIIRHVQVNVTVERVKVQSVAYVRDPSVGNREQGYRHIERVSESPEDSEAALAYELSRAEAYMQRAVNVAKALGLESEARDALGKIAGLRKKVRRRGSTSAAATLTS